MKKEAYILFRLGKWVRPLWSESERSIRVIAKQDEDRWHLIANFKGQGYTVSE
ncbi:MULTISPECIES: hypothetical protein [Brevibacillus]|uniref:hypothetical protein n=1 Tax=Brevibacillus TaxID=55080 RepID=UPI000E382EC0|nr:MULTISPECIES: hypothetical protein [Brevibacillus]RED27857.1 hypothetical protein DES34_109150 [Brevibacillus brevis]TQK53924.1 hypothetical protein FB479_108139 [Brevibacillus sp. AG162]GEC88695.1 hypothetical protein BBR01nite_10260 [Brevibacillus brevis]VEF86895.1 Uncharacterised protein [Brevibacillus brevis]